ncbi:Transposase [Bacteroidales bacterium Barb6XT]|nr:Transposase [Bacteroidales bacterium Barb6XT]OAV63833.1 Transposase [Bacteroidales bacterium Barb6XT]OAV65837.1 Transposase [Bacteroidales bacterium Barb6XT]OAV68347.1 Transposase [Bacteroidales bacterium Barb6XT]
MFVKKTIIVTTLHRTFKKPCDPRINRRKKYKLPDIIILSIPAVPCGAESQDSVEPFCKTNPAFLKQFPE